MKITAVKTVVVNAKLRNWIFVRVESDVPGLVGLGEATLEFQTRAVVGAIEDLAPLVIGEDPRRISISGRRCSAIRSSRVVWSRCRRFVGRL
jgi:galactonate dehydratase